MYIDFLRFYRPLHEAIIASGSLCVYLKSTIPEKKRHVVKTTPSKNVNLEMAKTVRKYITKMYSTPASLLFINRKPENKMLALVNWLQVLASQSKRKKQINNPFSLGNLSPSLISSDFVRKKHLHCYSYYAFKKKKKKHNGTYYNMDRLSYWTL